MRRTISILFRTIGVIAALTSIPAFIFFEPIYSTLLQFFALGIGIIGILLAPKKQK
jgi:hypothetical protein